MEKDIMLLKLAHYIITNHATISSAANEFKVSVRTIQLRLKQIELKSKISEDNNIDWKDLNDSIQKIKRTNEAKGKIFGGIKGKRSGIYSEEEAKLIAKYIINNGLTIEEASISLGEKLGIKYINIPTSTLYDTLMRIEDEDLKNELRRHFYGNKKNR